MYNNTIIHKCKSLRQYLHLFYVCIGGDPSSDDIKIIVGAIVGVMVLMEVVIIIIVVYFRCFHKKGTYPVNILYVIAYNNYYVLS